MNIQELYTIFLQHPVVSTDTRNIPAGCLFFALKGERFNGNTYASEAISKGAAYAIIDEEAYQTKNTILVTDVLTCLQELAAHHRQQLPIPFIGITGSNGKTTTKELLHAVLHSTYNTLATKGNLNNHIGVPLTLLSINSSHQMAIIEMGANHLGEIRELCNISDPDTGIITNIGKAHIEGFGSFEGVIKTKKELYDHMLRKHGPVFINRDNELLLSISQGLELISFGLEAENNLVSGEVAALTPYLHVKWKHGAVEFTTPTQLIGSYNLENVLAAITVGIHYGVAPDRIHQALQEYTPSNNRSQIEKTERNTLILDAYNANPTSMQAAIRNFKDIEAEQKFFLLGDMLELGNESAKEHQATCDLLTSLGLTKGILVGKEFKKSNTTIQQVESTDEAIQILKEKGLRDHLVLIKGSRGIRLERCAPEL